MDQPAPQPQKDPSLADWLARPVESFDLWLSPHLLANSTKRVYSAMWGKFVLYLSGQNLRLDACRSIHIWRFLEDELPNKIRLVGKSIHQVESAKKERKEQRQRYVRLIERVYDHLAASGLAIANPGREAGFARMGAGLNAPTKFLDSGECQKLFGAIHEFLGQPIPDGPIQQGAEWAMQWAAARDISLAGVMVGAGVRVEEVGRLSVNCTVIQGMAGEPGAAGLDRLRIPAVPGISAREALSFPLVGKVLAGWSQWRGLVPWADEGGGLFPPDLSRRRHDFTEAGAGMHAATIFRRISKVLTEAGITGNRVGGQTLRNTYIALLAEAGCNDMELMEASGLKTARSVLRLREKLKINNEGNPQ